MNPLVVLDRPIAFHRCLVKITGSINGALLMSQAIYWQNREKNQDGGWWWKTADEWEEETGMTRRELDTARAQCVSSGLLEYEVKGLPAKGYYRVNTEELGCKTSLAQNAKLDCTKAPNLIGEKRQTICTETSSKTTTEKESQPNNSTLSTESPQPPGSDAPPQPKRGDTFLDLVPENLMYEPFFKAWNEWIEFRKSKRKPVSRMAAKKQLSELGEWGLKTAIRSINYSIKNDWQGLFRKDEEQVRNTPRPNSNGLPWSTKLPQTAADL